jgi:hypothetical protein
MAVAMKPDRASIRRIEDGYDIPATAIAGGEEPPDPTLSPVLDDKTVAYVLEARGPFEGLRSAASQLAGLLVLVAIGSGTVQGNPMLEMAIGAHAKAADELKALTPTPKGAHHHLHLCLAAERLGEALKTARHSRQLDEAVSDRIHGLLKHALEDLRWASRALPGFELVNFSQGCCAMHSAPFSRDNKKTLRFNSMEEGR